MKKEIKQAIDNLLTDSKLLTDWMLIWIPFGGAILARIIKLLYDGLIMQALFTLVLIAIILFALIFFCNFLCAIQWFDDFTDTDVGLYFTVIVIFSVPVFTATYFFTEHLILHHNEYLQIISTQNNEIQYYHQDTCKESFYSKFKLFDRKITIAKEIKFSYIMTGRDSLGADVILPMTTKVNIREDSIKTFFDADARKSIKQQVAREQEQTLKKFLNQTSSNVLFAEIDLLEDLLEKNPTNLPLQIVCKIDKERLYPENQWELVITLPSIKINGVITSNSPDNELYYKDFITLRKKIRINILETINALTKTNQDLEENIWLLEKKVQKTAEECDCTIKNLKITLSE